MTKQQQTKIAERIAFRVNECGMTFSAAVRDCLQWFGPLDEEVLVFITCEAGRRIDWYRA